jgi:polysaccharide biosynthesis protein PslG
VAALRTVLPWTALLLPLLILGAANGAGRADGELAPAVHVLEFDDAIYRLAAEGGYASVVQVFPWRDIEPTPGEWHWQQPDFAVQGARYYGLGLIVRLDHAPEWALRPAQAGVVPFDLDAYAAFVANVARRYRGRVQAYIIWNEPNLSREWAGLPPDPAAYTALLCRGRAAVEEADPAATVVSAGLAPTNGGDGAVDDRKFLRGMYESGAGDCFDALGAHAYGFGHPPDDPQGSHDGLNLARLADLRAIVEEHASQAIPVWITEMGWTTGGVDSQAWQTVSPEAQAGYLVDAWRHIRERWPWVQVATVWNLSRGLPPADEMAGYSLLDRDGDPKPAYHALANLFAARSADEAPVAAARTTGRETAAAEVQILAADEVIHLGDDQ